MAYQPLPFEGALTPEQVVVAMGFGGDIGSLGGQAPDARASRSAATRQADGCVLGRRTGCPEIEVLDVRTGEWVQFAHMAGGQAYELENAARWVDPATRPGPGQVRQRAPGRDRLPVPGRDHGDRQMSGIVTASGLVKRYDRTLAVAGLDLDVAEGEIFGLVGPNGAGKTTTLRILATLLVPDGGRRRDRRLLGAPEPQRRASRPRVHAGLVRGVRRHEGLGVPGLLRPLLRHPGRPPAADDRRPPRPGGPRPQARHLRPGPVARHAAAAVPRPRAGPRPAGAAARRAGVGPRPAGPRRAARAAARAADPGQDDPRLVPHPPRARGAVHLGRDHRPRPGARPGPGRRHRAPAPGRGRVPRPRPRRRGRPIEAAQAWFAHQPNVVTAQLLEDGDDRDRVPRRRRRAPRALLAGARSAPTSGSRRSPAPRATSRSCSSR